MLIDAAEDRGPMLFAKMGIQRATERYTVPQGQSPFLTTVEAQDVPMKLLNHVARQNK
jgi:hypothetical protein